jgi:hypothetical protein
MVIILLGAGIVYVSLSAGSGQASTSQSPTASVTTTPSNSTTEAQGISSQSSGAVTYNSTSISTSTEQAATGPLQIPVSSASTSNPSTGIRLDLELAGFANGTLRISADEYNPNNVNENVSAGDDWLYSQSTLESYSASCSNEILPMGIAVFKGYFDASNFASAEALTIYDDAATGASCTATGNPAPTSYGFLPSSDFAAIYASQALMGGYNIQLSDWTGGSWTSNASSSSPAFTLFPNGNYTVIAGDEWGQVALLHFGVVRPSPQMSASPIELGTALVLASVMIKSRPAPTLR